MELMLTTFLTIKEMEQVCDIAKAFTGFIPADYTGTQASNVLV